MKSLVALTDYLNRFGSKWIASPYRSGMDKGILKESFSHFGYECEFRSYSNIDFRVDNYNLFPVVYSSSEDVDGYYRDYIEDILLGLEELGALIIPKYTLFRAHHNKVFMEILRDLMPIEDAHRIRSLSFGTLEELNQNLSNIAFPCVIKTASGASGSGVFCAHSATQLIKYAKKISRTVNWASEAWDVGRALKHKGYRRESLHRRKFIVQSFIEGLSHDWKVLVFGNRYYALRRNNRNRDFRASGSGLLEYREDTPYPVLDFASKIYDYLNIPNLSLDIAYDGTNVYLIEFQCVNFGTHTLDTAPFYFTKSGSEWKRFSEPSCLEFVYAESISSFLDIKYANTNNS